MQLKENSVNLSLLFSLLLPSEVNKSFADDHLWNQLLFQLLHFQVPEVQLPQILL